MVIDAHLARNQHGVSGVYVDVTTRGRRPASLPAGARIAVAGTRVT